MKDHDEKKMMSNMERVLRAMDVIPPFGGPVSPERAKLISSAQSQSDPVEETPAEEAQDQGNDVPTLDLGEKILAEQRRVTAGKRRGPGGGKPAFKPPFEKPPVVPTISPNEATTENLAELQSIVSDIVARDIEQLCTGPQRSFR